MVSGWTVQNEPSDQAFSNTFLSTSSESVRLHNYKESKDVLRIDVSGISKFLEARNIVGMTDWKTTHVMEGHMVQNMVLESLPC